MEVVRNPEAIGAFRADLLAETVEWCRQGSPFYRARFAAAGEIRGLDDLPRLPILRREEVIAAHTGFLCQRVQPACVQFTTGTSGPPLLLYRSPDEIEFISQFFHQLVHDEYGGEPTRPLFLSLANAYHGSPTPVPGWAYVLTSGISDRTQAEQALGLLDRSFELPGVASRISAVIGAEISIKALTAYLMEKGRNPADLGVVRLVFTGGYVSPARKRLLASLWRASIQDRYSLSEVFGGATECGVGGPWVFDTEVIPEVIHPRTLEPLREGIGVLVLTGLYPFMQMMPMVRYYTGDLVEIVAGADGGAPDLLVKLLGRERRSLFDSGGDTVVPILLSGPLTEILETFPDLAVCSRFRDLEAGLGLELPGKLHFEVDSALDARCGNGWIRLKLGLRYAPWLYPQRVAAITGEIREALCNRFPALQERIASQQVELSIETAPGEQVRPYDAK